MPSWPLLFVLVAVIGAGDLVLSDADSADRSPNRLVFYDGFNGKRLNRDRWRTCHWWAQHGCTIATNNELQWYLPEQVRVTRRRLWLVAERRRVRGSNGRSYRYASGMISSGPGPESAPAKFAFRYGRAEIRARVPRGRGLWSAFWLLPADRNSKPEIDVVEVLGHRPRTVEMHLHYREEGRVRQQGHEWTGLKPGWHRFAVDWRPGRLRWLVDGKERWEVTGDEVPDERMYLVANLAVGGDWPGPPSRSTRFPARLVIDWVKVWK